MFLKGQNRSLINFPSFYATWYEKNHLIIFNFFAAVNNLSLNVLLLLNLSVDIDKSPGPVSNYTDVIK